MTKKIYVDKSAIDKMRPPIVVEDGDQVYRATSVLIGGSTRLAAHDKCHISPDKKNVHVYIETDEEITIEK